MWPRVFVEDSQEGKEMAHPIGIEIIIETPKGFANDPQAREEDMKDGQDARSARIVFCCLNR